MHLKILKCILFNELHVFVPSVRIGCALWLLCGGVWVHLWIWNPHERRSAPEHESLPQSDSPEPPESEASLRDRWKHYTATEQQHYLRITDILNVKMANMKGLSRLEVANELQRYCDIIPPVSEILNSCLF